MRKERTPRDLNYKPRLNGMSVRVALKALAMVIASTGSVLPASADPIALQNGPLVLPFTINAVTVAGDFTDLFGVRIQRGDSLSGRVVIDSPPSADMISDPSHGFYQFMSGRFEFDVPSGFKLESSAAEPLIGVITDNHVASAFNQVTDAIAVESHVGDFVALAVWHDLSAMSFTNDSFPTSADFLSNFSRIRFFFSAPNTSGSRPPQIVISGTSEPAPPIPEPSTILLTLMGGAAIARRIVKSRTSVEPTIR
jgi:hypothetical protein